MTSSVAFSNFSNFQTRDPVNIPLARPRTTRSLTVSRSTSTEHAWAEDCKPTYRCSVGQQGPPYSYNFVNAASATTGARDPVLQQAPARLRPDRHDRPDRPVSDPRNTAAASPPRSVRRQFSTYEPPPSSMAEMSAARGAVTSRNDQEVRGRTSSTLRLSQHFPTGFWAGRFGVHATSRTSAT